jgi:predicted DNA-binding transcriptional regulator AlpA
MSEQLLTPTEVAKKLRISRTKFYRIRARLIANGMQRVTIDGSIKYLESSLDRMIRKAAEKEGELC